MPTISENKRDKWVAYGEDNNYYETLLKAKDSPTNSALINGISDMIYGKGLYATDANRKPDEYAQMIQLFSEDLMRKTADDFYTYGEASWQVIYDQGHTQILSVEHIPIQNLRPEKCNEEGDIEAYYYSDNWKDVSNKDNPERIPAFGMGNKGLEILVIRPYKTGFHYFSPVEWQSGIDYAFVEIELAKFHLNNIFNRFSANMIINFNNGVPSPDEQQIIERKVKGKYTGTEGDSVIVAFNENKEGAADIQTPQLNDAHNQYQFIAEEAARKLMVSHRVTSPLLFGLPQNGGLGSNADEIKMASQLMDNITIKPMQRIIVEAVQKVLTFNGISLNVFMGTSQPLSFTEIVVDDVNNDIIQEQEGIQSQPNQDNQVDDEVQKDLIQKEASYNGAQIASALQIMEAVSLKTLTQDQAITFLIQMLQFEPSVANALFSNNSASVITQMKSQLKKNMIPFCCSKDDGLDLIADDLIEMGEDITNDWVLVDEQEVVYEDEKQSLLSKAINFVSTGTARPNSKSEQDAVINGVQYKTRYIYAPQSVSPDSREFCRKMVAANKLYRKEDIIAMDDKAVNPGWGAGGANTYSIWKFKGGGACHHKWMRRIYKKVGEEGSIDVNNPNAETISTNASEKEGYRVRNPKEVAMKPKDMPNEGFLKPRG